MIKKAPVISFSKLETGMPMPNLLDIQTQSFQALLRSDQDADRADIALERVFREVFPITDVNGNYSLEFVSFSLGEPKYSVPECIERDMTYSASPPVRGARNTPWCARQWSSSMFKPPAK